MRKFCLLLALITGLTSIANAQLAGTKWKGEFNVPEPYPIILSFAADSVYMHTEAEGMLLETMTYKITGETLTITKEDGESPCDIKSTGTYTFKIEGDKLRVTISKDDCEARAMAWPSVPLARKKD